LADKPADLVAGVPMAGVTMGLTLPSSGDDGRVEILRLFRSLPLALPSRGAERAFFFLALVLPPGVTFTPDDPAVVIVIVIS